MFRLSLVVALIISFCSFGAEHPPSFSTKKRINKHDFRLARDRLLPEINEDHATSEFIASIYRLFFSEKEIDFAPLYKKFQLERTHPNFFSKWSKDPATFLCQLYPRFIRTQDRLSYTMYSLKIDDLPLFSRSIALGLKLSYHTGGIKTPRKGPQKGFEHTYCALFFQSYMNTIYSPNNLS